MGIERPPIMRPERWVEAITVAEVGVFATKRVLLAAIHSYDAESSGLGGRLRELDVGERVAVW